MKKILTILLAVLMGFALFGCSTNTIETEEKIVDDDPLIMYVNAKEHREYFMVKQYTKVSDFHPEDIIDVDINKDVDYTVEWVGESLSNQLDNYDDIVSKLGENAESEIQKSKKNTLDCESFRPISIYVSANNNGRKITKCLNTVLLVAPEKLYNDLLQNDTKRIEDAYIAIWHTIQTYGKYPYEDKMEEGNESILSDFDEDEIPYYDSGNVNYNQLHIAAFEAGKPKEYWSTGERNRDLFIEFGYISNISDNYDY